MILTKLWYRMYIRWLALQWTRQINLGDRVIYDNREFVVYNGVCGWSLTSTPERNAIGDTESLQYVPKDQVIKVRSIKNYYASYKSGVNFYTMYWLDIWCNQGIQPWVRGLNIWPRKGDHS